MREREGERESEKERERDIEGVPVCKLPPTFTETFRPRPKLKKTLLICMKR